MLRTPAAALVAALLLSACSGGSERRADPTPPTGPASPGQSGGPCTVGAGGLSCGPSGQPLTLDQVKTRLLSQDQIGRDRYSRAWKPKKRPDRVPGCDQRYIQFKDRPMVQTSYQRYWRDYPGRSWDKQDVARHTYWQIGITYSDPAQQGADLRKVWDSPCKGAKRIYERSTGQLSGWSYARRIQPLRCMRGGVCVFVTDYMRRDGLTLVTVLVEGGYFKERSTWKPVIDRANRFRTMLLKQMDRT